jgi:hypothetical protein
MIKKQCRGDELYTALLFVNPSREHLLVAFEIGADVKKQAWIEFRPCPLFRLNPGTISSKCI